MQIDAVGSLPHEQSTKCCTRSGSTYSHLFKWKKYEKSRRGKNWARPVSQAECALFGSEVNANKKKNSQKRTVAGQCTYRNDVRARVSAHMKCRRDIANMKIVSFHSRSHQVRDAQRYACPRHTIPVYLQPMCFSIASRFIVHRFVCKVAEWMRTQRDNRSIIPNIIQSDNVHLY